jgi:hypothetical protein
MHDHHPPAPQLDPCRRSAIGGGSFDIWSFAATYDFTYRDAEEAVTTHVSGETPSEPHRAIRHEIAHHYQMSTSPYGYYYHLLDTLQVVSVLGIVGLLRSTAKEVLFPLRRIVGNTTRTSENEALLTRFLVWSVAEEMKAYLEGTPYSNPLPPLVANWHGAVSCFEVLDDILPHLLNINRMTPHNVSQNLGIGPEQALFALNIVTGVHDRLLNAFETTNVTNILESAAFLAEISDVSAAFALDDFIPSRYEINDHRYFSLINRIRTQLGAISLPEFLHTFAAIAELSLFGPCLPEYAQFRSKDMLENFHPVWRIYQMWFHLQNIRPIKEPEDYERYCSEMCAKIGWATPLQLGEATIRNSPEQERGKIDKLYLNAQLARHLRPSIFSDNRVWRGGDVLSQEVRAQFIHPVIEYQDKTMYHKDKDLLQYHYEMYIHKKYTRQMMLTGNPVVRLPFRLPLEVTTELENCLRKSFANVGLENITVRVQSREMVG